MRATPNRSRAATGRRLASRAAAFIEIAEEMLDLAELAHASQRARLRAAGEHLHNALDDLRAVLPRKDGA